MKRAMSLKDREFNNFPTSFQGWPWFGGEGTASGRVFREDFGAALTRRKTTAIGRPFAENTGHSATWKLFHGRS
jgi:hypothetical protein